MIRELDLEISEIYEASSGSEALKIVIESKPDILLIDIMMPEMDGLELISNIRASDIKTHIVVVSSHNDFSYAKKAIDLKVDNYLLKPVTKKELFEILSSLLESIRTEMESNLNLNTTKSRYYKFLLYEFLSGSNVFLHQDKLFENTGVYLLKDPFYSIVIMQSDTSQDDELDNEKQNIDTLLMLSSCVFISFCIPPKKIIYIVNSHNKQDDSYVDIFKHSLIRSKLNLVCGISGIDENIDVLPDLYRQAYISLREGVFKGIKFHRYSETGGSLGVIVDSKKCEIIIDFIEKKMEKRLYEEIDVIFHEISMSKYSSESIRNELFSLVDYLSMNLKNKYANVSLSSDIRAELDNADTLFRMKVIVKREIDTIYALVNTIGQIAYSNPAIIKIIKYINSTITKDISLSYIANKLNLNYYYVSNMFTKEVGMSFSSYIIDKRLNMAKKLLENDSSKIYEIAKNVGFNDTKHFIKSFKKMFNETPTEYRYKHTIT